MPGRDNPNSATYILCQDRLVITTRAFRRGKRVPSNCPLTREEIREYVTKGTVAAVKLIRTNRNYGLREALDLLNSARQ